MSLPASFARDGFKPADYTRKYKRMMIGTEGETESGKTEFMLSAPGPGIIISIDRGIEGLLLNPAPPSTRRDDFAVDVITVPLLTGGLKDDFEKGWTNVRERTYKALRNTDALTVCLDTDNVSWELQQLAEFGKIAQVSPGMRMQSPIKSARRLFISRMFDSGKNVIASNMLTDDYEDVRDAEGKIKLDDRGRVEQVRSGQRRRQGFSDQAYLWQVQLRHLSKKEKKEVVIPAKLLGGKIIKPASKQVITKVSYGIEILKCKFRGDIVGDQLWDEDCNFMGLAKHIFPDTTPEEWGY